ncbi:MULTISPECIES: glycoside hydrolase family 75 protein [unclassified Streptomyces]|uniref:glycoside hydrolase family 75 protein n=1 Tax=unclassified Streptomyces TaxID=2593676 RepID=UPI00068EFF15|nr:MULTISPECIES: glycoside hydrolase family 75 protein [unclassified Streptomyces]
MRYTTSLSLVAASAALLAPAGPAPAGPVAAVRPQAPAPPLPPAAAERGAGRSHALAPQGGGVPGRSPVFHDRDRGRERPVLGRRGAREGRVAAADLLAQTRHCTPVSHGRFRSDAGARADIPVCGRHGAVFWKADMDIDCDGRAGRRCNRRTDPQFARATAFQGPDGRRLDAEKVPYIVVPEPSRLWDHRADGVRGGSVAAVIHGDRVQYAVVGDTGPRDIIGEASYATAKGLGIRPDPRGGGTDDDVTYVVFPHSAVPSLDREATAERGEELAREFLRRSSGTHAPGGTPAHP